MDPDVTQDGTLEETVYNFIKKWQGVENGKGVGITIDHLNRNIVHPNKKKGKDSRKKFYSLLREMKSLCESEELWNGQVVFLLKEQQSKLEQAKNSRSAVAYGMQIRSNVQHNEPQSELQQAKNLLFVIVNEMENHMKALLFVSLMSVDVWGPPGGPLNEPPSDALAGPLPNSDTAIV